MPLCWIYQKAISLSLDADAPLSDRLRRHVRSCPCCHAFYQAQTQLAEKLIAESGEEVEAPSPFLLDRIMVSLDRGIALPEPKTSTLRWSVAAAAAVFLLAGGWAVRQFEFSKMPSHTQAPSNATPSLFTAEELAGGRKLLAWSQNLEQPLETELHSVVADAKSAVQILADNFLPETFLVSSFGTPFDR